MSSQTTLSAASDDRKARLANLRNLKRKQPTDEIVAPESQRSPSPPAAEKDVTTLHLSGRNYDAETRGPKLGFEAPPTLGLERATLEEQAGEVEQETRQRAEEDARDEKGVDLFKLQPKKPNWDLKRDMEKKMEVLNVRTDNAIARLVRERIKGSAAKKNSQGGSTNQQADGEESVDMDGVALVEGLRMREKEEEEAERREKAEDEASAL